MVESVLHVLSRNPISFSQGEPAVKCVTLESLPWLQCEYHELADPFDGPLETSCLTSDAKSKALPFAIFSPCICEPSCMLSPGQASKNLHHSALRFVRHPPGFGRKGAGTQQPPHAYIRTVVSASSPPCQAPYVVCISLDLWIFSNLFRKGQAPVSNFYYVWSQNSG